MSFLSRFLGDKKREEDPLAGLIDGGSQPEGLFMPPPLPPVSQPVPPHQAAPPVPPPGDGEALSDAAPADEPAAEALAEKQAAPEDGTSSTAADDVLASFRSDAGGADLHDLAKEVDDVTVDQLLTQLRELRELFRQSQPTD